MATQPIFSAKWSALTLALAGALAGFSKPLAAQPTAPTASATMGLGYIATCGSDVNVYSVWFAPIPNGSQGSFVSFKNPDQDGAPFVVEAMEITPTGDQSFVGRSASVTLTADLAGTGSYSIRGQAPVEGCKVYPYPTSSVSVGN